MARVKTVFLLSVMFCCWSCKSDDKMPEDILTKTEMINVMIDIRIAEGTVVALALPQDSAKVVFSVLEEEVFKKHELDTITYQKSYRYYLQNPEMMVSISNAVIDSLKVRQDTKRLD